jgi:aminopeptidase N
MVLIDPQCWLIKELDFDKTAEENLYQLDHASCVLCRLDAARALAKQYKEEPEVKKALASAWKKEKSVTARTEMITLIAGGEDGSRRGRRMARAVQAGPPAQAGDEDYRHALMEAARDHEARVRVVAIGGLTKLKQSPESESILRATWSNPKESYGARRAALQGLVAWKIKDADEFLALALKVPAGKHTLAAAALELLLEQPGAKARELAALYSKYGQPRALRSAAIGAFDRLAKDDPALQDLVIPMVDDPDRSVRFRAWGLASSLKLKKALPALEARLGHENFGFTGFTGFGVRQLQEAIATLKGSGPKPPATPAANQDKPIADLEKQAEELETKAKELRKRIEALRPKLSSQ